MTIIKEHIFFKKETFKKEPGNRIVYQNYGELDLTGRDPEENWMYSNPTGGYI